MTFKEFLQDAEVAEYVSFGVKVDGGGFIIVNGVVHHVGPIGPLDPIMRLGLGVAAVRSVEVVHSRVAAAEIAGISEKVLGMAVGIGAMS